MLLATCSKLFCLYSIRCHCVPSSVVAFQMLLCTVCESHAPMLPAAVTTSSHHGHISNTSTPQPLHYSSQFTQLIVFFSSGAIPNEFAKLSRLEYLDLSSNKLSKLPDIGATLLKLNSNGTDRKCNLSQNHFGCPVPESLEYPSACGAVCGVYIDSV